jgi:hypothetical protein
MFVVTDKMRAEVREAVRQAMAGERPGVRGLGIPTYLGGDFKKRLGANPRSVQERLNPIDPATYKSFNSDS